MDRSGSTGSGSCSICRCVGVFLGANRCFGLDVSDTGWFTSSLLSFTLRVGSPVLLTVPCFGRSRLQCSSYVCARCFPLHAGQVILLVAAKLCSGFCPHLARNITSSIGWLLVATDKAYLFKPKTGQVRNSPAGVCSMFILKFLICSTEKRIGTRPLSKISTVVVTQPVGCFGFFKCMINFSLTCEDSPFANENLLLLASLVNLIKWEYLWFIHAFTNRSIANLEPIALVHPESRITKVGFVDIST